MQIRNYTRPSSAPRAGGPGGDRHCHARVTTANSRKDQKFSCFGDEEPESAAAVSADILRFERKARVYSDDSDS